MRTQRAARRANLKEKLSILKKQFSEVRPFIAAAEHAEKLRAEGYKAGFEAGQKVGYQNALNDHNIGTVKTESGLVVPAGSVKNV